MEDPTTWIFEDPIATWKKEFAKVFAETGDTLNGIEITPDIDLDREFDSGFGGTNGTPFVAWSHDWVYFPACYDGAEWIAYVPRNPTKDYTPGHIGGG